MYHHICRTILHGRHSITHSLTHQLHCLRIHISHLSTTSNQHSFTVSYLINSCGLSQDSALQASKYVQFDSRERPDSVVAFFKKHGFSESHISGLVRGHPQFLLSNPEKTLLPKITFFYSKGFSIRQLTYLVSVFPRILTRSIEKHLSPTFDYICDVLQSRERAITAIKRSARLLHEDIEAHLAPNLHILRKNGVPESNIGKLFYTWPRVVTSSVDFFENVVEEVKEMGINPLKVQFVAAIAAKVLMSRSLWEKKVNAYKKWGLSEEEILSAFAKCPGFMMTSEHKIMEVMDFFVNKMGWDASIIANRPVLVAYSVEKRIVPRGTVIQFLSSKGLMKRNYRNMVSLFDYSEQTFLQRFVNSYDGAPQLLKLYKEKLNLSKMKKSPAYTGRSLSLRGEFVSDFWYCNLLLDL